MTMHRIKPPPGEPPRDPEAQVIGVGGIAAAVALGVFMMVIGYSLGRGSAQPYPAPVLVSAACPSASLPPPSASAEAPVPTGRPDALEAPQAAPGSTAKRSKDDELVRSAVGRWRGDDGLTVEVDPPKPLPGRSPPFRLVVRGKGLPKSGFGCEFAGGGDEPRRGPGELVYFKAWCARGKRAMLGLEVNYPEGAPTMLTVVILQDGELRVRARGQRIDPTGEAP